jgi:putative ABC transport system permease protein
MRIEHWWFTIPLRLKSMLRRGRLEQELSEELQFHLEHKIEEGIAEGLSPEEARFRALRSMGGLEQKKEEVRDTRRVHWLTDFVDDVRYALRSLTKSWGFALGAGAVLTLSIGATVALFSIVHTVLLRPLAYPESERLVSIETLWTESGRSSQDVSGPDFLDWKTRSDVFETMAVANGGDNDGDDSATIVGDRAVFANARYVSADFFAVFGQNAAAGRLLTERDVPTGDAIPAVAVVAHHWGAAHFGSAEAAIGKVITVYGEPMEIVGVAAAGFRYPGAADLWAPWPTASGDTYQAVGRLKRGVDLARARAQMRAIGDASARQSSENRLKTVALVPLQERLTGNLRVTLWVLMGAVGVVWLIACANIGNLLLARAVGRRHEIALRAALGAGRGRVLRQLLTESSVLAGLAGLAGLLLASLLVQGIVALAPANLLRIGEVRIDMTALLFALALSAMSTVFFGLMPAVQTSRLDLSDALRQGGSKATPSKAGSRFRTGLVVAEVALSVILLVTAGLLLRSFRALQREDLGFTTSRVLVAYTDYAVNNETEIRVRSAFYADLLDRLRAVPGVRDAAGIAFLPMGREPRAARDIFVQGRAEEAPGKRPRAEVYAITPDYFRTLEIPIRFGRDFDRTETPERPPVAIINETLARTVFPGGSTLGRQIRWSSTSPWMEIVGVVGDTRWQDPSLPPPSVVFVSSLQGWGKSLSILARTSLDEKSLAGTLRTLLHDANPSVPVRLETMEELFDFALAYPRFRTRVIGMFAGVAALLAAVGTFSVLAFLVGQRTRELAIRRALGARVSDVFRLIVGEGLRLVGIGLVLGMAGAFAVARLLTGLLYEISPWDIATYLGTIVLIGGVAFLATLLPAIRASAITPLIVLRQD